MGKATHPTRPNGVAISDTKFPWKVGIEVRRDRFELMGAFPTEAAADDYSRILMVRNPGKEMIVFVQIDEWERNHPLPKISAPPIIPPPCGPLGEGL